MASFMSMIDYIDDQLGKFRKTYQEMETKNTNAEIAQEAKADLDEIRQPQSARGPKLDPQESQPDHPADPQNDE